MKLDYSKIKKISEKSKSLRINNTPQSRNIQVWVNIDTGSVGHEELLDTNSWVEVDDDCVTVGYISGPISFEDLKDLVLKSLYGECLNNADFARVDRIISAADSKQDALDGIANLVKASAFPIFEDEDYAKAARYHYYLAFRVCGPRTRYKP